MTNLTKTKKKMNRTTIEFFTGTINFKKEKQTIIIILQKKKEQEKIKFLS